MGRKERRALSAKNKRLAGKTGSAPVGSDQNPLALAARLFRAGRLADARKLTENLIRDPRVDPQVFALHGAICWHMGDPVAASESLKRAVNRGNQDFDTLYRLAAAQLMLGRHEEALAAADQALALNPEVVDLHNFRGSALEKLGRTEDALAACRKALALDNNRQDVHANLANLLERLNRLDEAWEAAQAGLALFPNDVPLQVTAARCERRRGEPQAALQRLKNRTVDGLPPALAGNFYHELGQIHDYLSEPEEAFEAFSRSGRIAASAWTARHPEPNPMLDEIRHLTERCSADWLASWSRAAAPSGPPAPAFLIGFPRSGTTLLERVIDSHPKIQTLEEQPMIRQLRDEVAQLSGGYPDALAHLSESQQKRLRKRYFKEVDARIERRPDSLIVDKMPLNTAHVALIHRVFPDARFILALRHPCDVCLSCFMQDFRPNYAMANFFTLESTITFYKAVMGLWRSCSGLLKPKLSCGLGA